MNDLKNMLINADEVARKLSTRGFSLDSVFINENSNIQIIIKDKSENQVSNLLDELIQDHKDQGNLKKIESLEQKLINNLDENSYSELIKLKSSE